MVDYIAPLAEYINELVEMALPKYRTFARQVETGAITDLNEIARQLDYMLDFCHNDKVLVQFKRILRCLIDEHYGFVASYVESYRKLWDEDYVDVDDQDEEYEQEGAEADG